MSPRFDQDLTSWERGEISLDELAARHPDQDVFGVADLYGRLLATGREPTPDPRDGWDALSPRLQDAAPTGRGRRWATRAAVGAAAVFILTTGLALAFEPIRQGATWLFRQAVDVADAVGVVEPLAELLAPLRAETLRAEGYEDSPVSWIPSVTGGDSLRCMLLEPPAHGRAGVHADCSGGWYRPSPDFHGGDSFTYVASEGDRLSGPATVQIILQPINDAPAAAADAVATDEDSPVRVPVLANDGDVDLAAPGGTPPEAGAAPTDGLTVSSVLETEGSVVVGQEGIVYRPPADFHGVAEFRYSIEDELGASDWATVRVRVRPVNDAPVSGDVVASGEEDSPIGWAPATSDVDGDTLTCSIADPPEHGQASVREDCTAGTYVGGLEFSGSDVLSFTVTDGVVSTTALATLSVDAVNDPPVADAISASGEEDSPVGWLPVTSDVEGDSLTCSILDPPAHGQASVQADCSGGTYVPEENYHGEDVFTYTVGDGTSKAEKPASVKVSVRPVNDPPAPGGDAVSTIQGVAIAIAVLSNDTDVDGDVLTVTSIGPAGAGSVSLNADGTITYTPGADFIGSDSFGYTVSDPSGASAVGSVVVTVHPPPPPPPLVDAPRLVVSNETAP